MFQPETEDMLPRAAPKPTTPLEMGNNAAAIARPTVPEVSILFGAQEPDIANVKAPQQSYAAWKKQMQPKVTFPPMGAEVYSVDGHIVGPKSTTATGMDNAGTTYNTVPSNIYPLRITTVTVPTSINTSVASVTSTYRRSYETTTATTNPNNHTLLQQRRSLDTIPLPATSTNRPEILTICAGTQTDPASSTCNSVTHLSGVLDSLATKTDVQQLLTIVNAIYMEQLRMNQLCETLLLKFEAVTPAQIIRQSDACTQCSSNDFPPEETNTNPPHVASNTAAVNGYNQSTRAHYQLASPAAESTAYQLPTPRHNCDSPIRPNLDMNEILPKASTEKSIIMNELALKYLPNEKLNELLRELNIGTNAPTPVTPARSPLTLRQRDILERAPTDISNASYKYLRKYRLLPNECGTDKSADQEQIPNGGELHIQSPLTVNSRQPQSPYQFQPQQMAAPFKTDGTQRAAMLDLEHIRNQPKLL